MSLIDEVCYRYDKDKVDELFKEYYKGNKDVENDLILYNYTLVKKIVNSVNVYNMYDIDELESEGLIALINSIRSYDPSLGNCFSTYATICIKNRLYAYVSSINDKLNKISLDSIIKGTEDVKLEDLIVPEDDCFSDYLQNDYINSLFLNIPLEYRDIAYKYFVQNLSIFDLKDIYDYKPYQFKSILVNCKNILIKAIEESKLSDREIIINRYNELDDKVRERLVLYLQGYNFSEIERMLGIKHVSYSIKRGIKHIDYPFEVIKDVILSSNISRNEDLNKELFILNGILSLNNNQRNCLFLNLQGYSKKEIGSILNISSESTGPYVSSSIKKIGYTKAEIKDVLVKYNILDNYSIEFKSTLDIARYIFKDYNNYSDEYIKDIMDRFYNLPKVEQDCIVDYINKMSNDDMVSKYNLTFGQVKRDMERKFSSLGGTKEEVRYCLAKKM